MHVPDAVVSFLILDSTADRYPVRSKRLPVVTVDEFVLETDSAYKWTGELRVFVRVNQDSVA